MFASFLDAHPLRDRPRGQRMLALYRSGRQVEALRVFQDYRRYLDETIGVEPSTELRALESQIVARDAGLQIRLPEGRSLRGTSWGRASGRALSACSNE